MDIIRILYYGPLKNFQGLNKNKDIVNDTNIFFLSFSSAIINI